MLKLLVVFALACLASGLPTNQVPTKIQTDGAWEESGLYQGDIMFNGEARNVVTNQNLVWKGEIPVKFGSEFNANELATIRSAIATITSKTCIKFRDYKSGDVDFINVRGDPTGCWSYIGKIGNGQDLNLQRGSPGCVFTGTAAHEFIHALGLYHQQSSWDRDDYVRINWENIEAGKEGNFDKYTKQQVTNYDLPYDYDSVMHYGRTSFSNNGKDTITPLKSGVTIGQRDHVSVIDYQKLNKLYGC